jgi:Raf kinase inhibitor-like YbhB/YbcL family protein
MGRMAALLLAGALLVGACASPAAQPSATPLTEGATMTSPTPAAGARFTLASAAFGDGEPIPRRHTCQGEDLSPPLTWTGLPAGTAALAIIVDDPDARGWVHWVAHGIPPAPGGLAEGASGGGALAEGETTWGTVGWRGPCPPSGTHRYVFSVYALDGPLDPGRAPTADQLRAAMRGHILGEASLAGTYRKG